ncbi:MAG TPA: asparagine synthetase A [Petrotogaceae bacterium]|nr:asparagine synthetase A [Petrotogaceae bacterium]
MDHRDIIKQVKQYTDTGIYRDSIKFQDIILTEFRNFLHQKGFLEILPVTVSNVTDPLNHEVFHAGFSYYQEQFTLTKSMIIHKQIAVLVHEKIYCISPNVRLETSEKAASGRHLYDFVQLDMEMLKAGRDDVMDIMEEMIAHTIKKLLETQQVPLGKYHPDLKVPSLPFKKISVKDAFDIYGKDYEYELSIRTKEPFWLIDMPIEDREFYDRQNDYNPDILADFDLIYPKGFGEGISGGEREYEYERILKRMKLKGTPEKNYEDYLKLAKEGMLKPSAGCGIGIERFTRYIMNLDHVEKTRLFSKVPGISSI